MKVKVVSNFSFSQFNFKLLTCDTWVIKWQDQNAEGSFASPFKFADAI